MTTQVTGAQLLGGSTSSDALRIPRGKWTQNDRIVQTGGSLRDHPAPECMGQNPWAWHLDQSQGHLLFVPLCSVSCRAQPCPLSLLLTGHSTSRISGVWRQGMGVEEKQESTYTPLQSNPRRVWVGRDLKADPVPPTHGQGHLALLQAHPSWPGGSSLAPVTAPIPQPLLPASPKLNNVHSALGGYWLKGILAAHKQQHLLALTLSSFPHWAAPGREDNLPQPTHSSFLMTAIESSQLHAQFGII